MLGRARLRTMYMSNETIFVYLCIIACVSLLLVYRHNRQGGLKRQLKPVEIFDVGKYLTGLPKVSNDVSMNCWVTATQFVFVTKMTMF